MPSEAYPATARYSAPSDARDRLDSQLLLKLLADAAATVDSDRRTAKACIHRAAELLREVDKSAGHQGHQRNVMRGGLAPWKARRVVAHIEAHIGSSIRAHDLAGIARMSRGHFFRAFRESFGEPPFAYIMRQRIRRAQTLMLNSRTRLSQIALDCGLSDQSHFTRVFRNIVGVNPGVWRRQLKTQIGVAGGMYEGGTSRTASFSSSTVAPT